MLTQLLCAGESNRPKPDGLTDAFFDPSVLGAHLDDTLHEISSGRVQAGMEKLINTLNEARSSVPELVWYRLISTCRAHPLCALLHQDPLTLRSWQKPRGYPGDAVLLDMIYDVYANGESNSEIGNAIFRYTAGNGRSPQAVRNRKSLIARMVDDVCAERDHARILSIAAGHLREAEQSETFAEKRMAEWVAIDQDEQSIEECKRHYHGTAVRPIQGSVRDLLRCKLTSGQFDFVYAAGLFDYLSESIANALLSRMFSLLTRGGKLLVANFAHGHADAGYMEAFMDWRLIYRTKTGMQNLLTGLDRTARDRIRLFTDQWGAIIYATAEKGFGRAE